MNWPIIIPQDKCAVDCHNMRISASEVGFMDPSTGPWAGFGFYWKWGCASYDEMLFKLMGN